MQKIRLLFLTLLLTLSPSILKAQDDELVVGLRAGHNTVFGGFAAVSLEAVQRFCSEFAVNAGLQYNTIGKTSFEARPEYDIPFDWGKVSLESILAYTNLSSINSFAAGLGAAVDSRNISAKLGYYCRLYGGQGGRIIEPFNVYYELRAHFLRKIKDWILDLVITNCEKFELERHYQPSFIAEGCYYPTNKLGITFGIGCKPSGVFNISADYYQSYLKTGVCYRW